MQFTSPRLTAKPAASQTRRKGKQHRLGFECLEARRQLAIIFTVTSADDTFGAGGGMTLRDAITAVNNDLTDTAVSPDVINFNIAGTPTINLAADLPALASPVTIDGTTQPGVTVNGNGFAMLVVDTAATVTSATFTGGTAAAGAASDLTVSAGTAINAIGDLSLGSSSTLNNHGQISVSGNIVGSASAGIYNLGAASLNVVQNVVLGFRGYVYNGLSSTDAGTFIVGGGFTAGFGGYVDSYGTSSLKVTGDFTLGNDGFLYNGLAGSDAATLTIGGKFTIGDSTAGPREAGNVYNLGNSAIVVKGDFTIFGDGGSFLYNGLSATDAAMFTVGGSFSLGGEGYVYNYGTSSLIVTGDFTLGNLGYAYNGVGNDAATLTVGGNFTIGNAAAGPSDSGFIYNSGQSIIDITKNLMIYGDYGSTIENGHLSGDTASLTVGGTSRLGAKSFVSNYGTARFEHSLTVGRIQNDSEADVGVMFSDIHHVVGPIDGAGNAVLNSASELTATHIVQNSLVIGANTVVTIAPSDAAGNPLAAAATSVSAAATSSSAASAVVAASLLSPAAPAPVVIETPVDPPITSLASLSESAGPAQATTNSTIAAAAPTNKESNPLSIAAMPPSPSIDASINLGGSGRTVIDPDAADDLFSRLGAW